jgi:hypothetical protein
MLANSTVPASHGPIQGKAQLQDTLASACTTCTSSITALWVVELLALLLVLLCLLYCLLQVTDADTDLTKARVADTGWLAVHAAALCQVGIEPL